MTSPRRYQMFVDGRFVDAQGGGWLESTYPFDGQVWAEIPRGGAGDVDAAVAAASRALRSGPWATMTASDRGALLRRLGDLIARDADELAEAEVRDNGKLLAEMRAQMGYLPQWYYYYGGLADKVEGSVVPIDRGDIFAYTRNEPVGVVAAITPWNSPLLLASYKIAPALAAGATLVLKPSEYASVSALVLARLVQEAGFPDGVFNVVTGLGEEAGVPLVSHRDVAKVAFTGGETGGIGVYKAAADGLKGALLELGGKSPNIVFADANLDNAVKGVVAGIFAAGGQTCIAGSRLLLQDSVHDEFVDKLVAAVRDVRLGDPMDSKTQVGPIATRPQYEKILHYLAVAKREGATCVVGGEPLVLGQGHFVPPTIFTGVDNSMTIAREEVFGPILSVIRFRDEDEAVAIANDTDYGLAAGVWTENLARALRVERRLHAGTVWVNTYRAISVTMPFGGFKRSGIGRENGIAAIREYMEQKAVWINISGQVSNPFVVQ